MKLLHLNVVLVLAISSILQSFATEPPVRRSKHSIRRNLDSKSSKSKLNTKASGSKSSKGQGNIDITYLVQNQSNEHGVHVADNSQAKDSGETKTEYKEQHIEYITGEGRTKSGKGVNIGRSSSKSSKSDSSAPTRLPVEPIPTTEYATNSPTTAPSSSNSTKNSRDTYSTNSNSAFSISLISSASSTTNNNSTNTTSTNSSDVLVNSTDNLFEIGPISRPADVELKLPESTASARYCTWIGIAVAEIIFSALSL